MIYNCDYCTCYSPKWAGDREEGYYCETCQHDIGPDKIAEAEAYFEGSYIEPDYPTQEEDDWYADVARDRALEIIFNK